MKPKQIVYQIHYKIRSGIGLKTAEKKLANDVRQLKFEEQIANPSAYHGDKTFKFLNKKKEFERGIEWNFSGYGKLWAYNLNYFDFLLQPGLSKDDGVFLIENYLQNDLELKDGKEPYPISLRGMNWIKFISKHHIRDKELNQVLYNHYQILSKSREFHLLGNHLLENGFSLLFGAYYFQDTSFLNKANEILKTELKEQILEDGAHFELSPMYHQIILHRVLDCYNLVINNDWDDKALVSILRSSAVNMLGWLEAITYEDGSIPMVNDSTRGIAPSSRELVGYAKKLGLQWQRNELKDCGYRKWKGERYELLMDVGAIGPDYIPGHAHADTFNFELVVSGKPFIVDTGISTYEKNSLRQSERSTFAHNTVVINGQNSSNVWGGFRVAQRAKVNNLSENESSISAEHTGYSKYEISHKRTFEHSGNKLTIIDEMIGKAKVESVAKFHLHPDIKAINIKKEFIEFSEIGVKIKFDAKELYITEGKYLFCTGFNVRVEAMVLSVAFRGLLKTTIEI